MVITIVVVVAVGTYVVIKYGKKMWLAGIVVGLVGGFVASMITMCFEAFVPTTELVFEKTKTERLMPFTGSYGSEDDDYFLYGSLDGNPIQFVYRCLAIEDGEVARERRITNLIIMIDNDEEPRLEEHKIVGFVHWWTYLYTWNDGMIYYVAFVPEGTVKIETPFVPSK